MRSKIRALFLLDGIGGVATAFMTGVVLPRFFDSGGMPGGVLIAFSLIGMLCGVYSLICRFFVRGGIARFLRAVVTANILYVLVTIGCVIRFYDRLNPLGLAYFVSEVLVILLLVSLEVIILRKPSVD
jgi:FlaA1/EpsC-like NDP-sugar epimerase